MTAFAKLGESLERLVADIDSPLIGADEIGTTSDTAARRLFRLSFADGRCLKGRLFPTPERASSTWRILTETSCSLLCRPISHCGNAILEPWIDGTLLQQDDVGLDRLRDAGRALGLMHALPIPADRFGVRPRDVDAWREKSLASVDLLRDHALVDAERATMLIELLHGDTPLGGTYGIVHRDLSPPNLIVDVTGRLISVDNGSVTIGLLEHDLCRVWYRWPMTERERVAFNDGYRGHCPLHTFAEPSAFWLTVVVVNAARFNLQRRDDALAALQRIEHLAARALPAPADARAKGC